MPDKAELPLKLVLPRAVIERLMVRAKAGGLPQPSRVADGPAGAGLGLAGWTRLTGIAVQYRRSLR